MQERVRPASHVEQPEWFPELDTPPPDEQDAVPNRTFTGVVRQLLRFRDWQPGPQHRRAVVDRLMKIGMTGTTREKISAAGLFDTLRGKDLSVIRQYLRALAGTRRRKS